MTYQSLTWLWIGIGGVAGLYLLRVPAPYGRHASAQWGPLIDNRLGWFLMEVVVLVVFWGVVLRAGRRPTGPALAMALLFTLHYVHRAFVFPLRLRTRGKRMPLVIAASAVAFNIVNGSLLGWHFAYRADYPATWYRDPRFGMGLAMFAAGMATNLWADRRLIRLRAPGQAGYAIPRGGLFELVSCPNHLGEIVEWSGYAVLTWSLPGFAFAFWTAANLVPRALAHHEWYRRTFDDYPAGRKAIIPLIL